MNGRAGAAAFALAAVGASLILVPAPRSLAGAGLGALAVWIARADIAEFRIPNLANLAAAALGLATAAMTEGFSGASAAIERGAAMSALFFAFRGLYRWARGREGLGLGDVKLAGVAGLWLETDALAACVDIACAAACAAVIARRLGGSPIDLNARLPFGAFLAPAIWATWLWLASSH